MAAIVLGTLAILTLIASGVFWRVAVSRRDRALERVRVSGAQLLPPAPQAPSAESAATVAWLEQFGAVRDGEGHTSVPPEPSIECLFDAALLERQPLELRQKLEQLRPCVASGSIKEARTSWSELAERVKRDIDDATPLAELDACEIAWMNTHGLPLDAGQARWSEACSLAPLDPPQVRAADRLAASALGQVLIAQPRMLDPVLALAMAGDATQALGRVRCALAMSKLYAHQQGRIGFAMAPLWMQVRAAESLRSILPFLPPHTSFGDLPETIVPLDPEHQLLLALQQDRAVGNEIYSESRFVVLSLHDDRSRAWWVPGRRAWDHAEYLEYFERGLALLEQPTWQLFARALEPGTDSGLLEPPRFAPVAGVILPDFEQSAQNTASHTARLRMTRLSLVAFERGVDIALAEAQKTIDPFNGKPLHARGEADGVVAFWSVGPDLKDQNAPHLRDIDPSTHKPYEDLPDLVVRIRLP